MRHLVRVLMILFGLAMTVAGPADGEWAVAAIGFGLIVGAAIWWFVDHPSDAPPTTAGPVSTALGTVEHGLMYPIPARKRWVLAVGSPIFGAIFVVLVPGMRADGEGLWWFVGGFGLLMVVAAPWLIKLARNPSYLAATRSGITYHGARRTITTGWEDMAAIELFEIRHARGGRTRMLGVACDPDRIQGLSGWQQKLGGWGMRSYGYSQSWPTWQFDADPDSRRELDTITAEQPATSRPLGESP